MDQQISSELPHIQTSQVTEGLNIEPDVIGSANYSERRANQAIEQGVSTPVPQTVAQPPLPVTTPAPTMVDPAAIADATSPQIADDTDLIEKEWVLKAKEIVERTKHDPYQQNVEVERIKADYMQKRYNKELKVAED